MKYRPEIDGLRAIAVLPVIFFHAGFAGFDGGFVGVDIFFVISGYLITTIIYKELQEKRFSIINFYERRARRLLPTLFLVMSATAVASWLVLMPSEMRDFSKSIIAVIAVCSNILFWKESNYWDVASDLKPLIHTWSLSVEEQFYIIFPLLLIILKKAKRLILLRILAVLFILSLVIAQWGAYNEPVANFYLLPTRAWELLIGAMCALILSSERVSRFGSNKKINETFCIVGLILILYSIVFFNSETPFPSIYAIIPTLGTALLILFCSKKSLVGIFLSNKLFVSIGLISYSLYLWHQPIFAFARQQTYDEPAASTFWLLLLPSIFLAYLSWRYVESPFRNKELYTRKRIFILSGVGSLILTIFGAFGLVTNGFENRHIYTKLKIGGYEADNQKLKIDSWSLLKKRAKDQTYHLQNNISDQTLWFEPNDKRKKVLIFGNSHSKDVYNVFSNSESIADQFQIARYGGQISDEMKTKSLFFKSPNYLSCECVVLASRYTKEDLQVMEQFIVKLLADSKNVVVMKNIFEFKSAGSSTLTDFLYRKKCFQLLSNNEMSNCEAVTIIDHGHYNYFLKGPSESIKNTNSKIVDLGDKYEIMILDRDEYAKDNASQRWFALSENLQKYYYDYGHHTLDGAQFFGNRIDVLKWADRIIAHIKM